MSLIITLKKLIIEFADYNQYIILDKGDVMAEIHIQKKRPPVWPWILGVLLVIIVAFLMIETNFNRDTFEDDGIVYLDTLTQDYTFKDTANASAKVNDFVEFVSNGDTLSNRGKADDQEFITEGVKKLSGALKAVVDEKYPDNDEMKNKADFIQQKSDSLALNNRIAENSREIKEVFNSTIEVISSIQQQDKQQPGKNISEVKETVQKINVNKPAADQKETIRNFFKETGQVLQTLARSDVQELNNTRRF